MRGLAKLPPLLATVILLAVGIAACGGGSGSTTAASGPDGSQGGPGSTESAKDGSGAGGSTASDGGGSMAAKGAGSSGAGARGETGGGSSGSASGAGGDSSPAHQDSGGGAAQFRIPGGDNSVQEFGREASGSELKQAAAALHAFLDARAGEEWAKACSYMTQGTRQSIEQLASHSKKLQGKGCAAILGALSAPLPAATRADLAKADVGALRIEGDRGFILYRGARNTDYAIPVGSEGGRWKVASIAATPLT